MIGTKTPDIEIPKWDVALEALVKEEHGKQGKPLTLEDFRRLANQYTIRLDDIMATLLELAVHGRWRYCNPQGIPQIITRDEVDALHKRGRIQEADMQAYGGSWHPVRSAE